MKLKLILPTIVASGVMLLATATNSYAMPNFARAYGKNCEFCHTEVPQLNRTGYEFRLAGYRLPDEIGQKEKYSLERLFAARFQTRSQFSATKHAATTSQNVSKAELTGYEVTLYPMTGSWEGYFGSLMELSMAPGEGFEIENAFVRGVYGDENGWFEGRVGIMHPWEGFGASDRPLGNTRPLFQKANTKAGTLGGSPGSIASPFYLWNIDEAAIEIGYYYKPTGTTLTGRIGMGSIWKQDALNPGDLGDPVQGGTLSKANQGYPGNKNPRDSSYQIVVNQFINDESGLTLYYYASATPYPDPFCYDWQNGGCDSFIAPTVFTKDSFQRFAAYANYYVVPKTVNLNGGFAYGHDSIGYNPALTYNGTNVSANTLKSGTSLGYFVEADYHIIAHELAVGYRYDFFNPNQNLKDFTQTAHTLILSYHPFNSIEFILDAQTKSSLQGIGKPTKTDNLLLGNLVVIF